MYLPIEGVQIEDAVPTDAPVITVTQIVMNGVELSESPNHYFLLSILASPTQSDDDSIKTVHLEDSVGNFTTTETAHTAAFPIIGAAFASAAAVAFAVDKADAVPEFEALAESESTSVVESFSASNETAAQEEAAKCEAVAPAEYKAEAEAEAKTKPDTSQV